MGSISTFPQPKSFGMPPLNEPIVGEVLSQMLVEDAAISDAEHAANRSKDPARLRASDAGSCERKIGFGIFDTPKDIEFSPQSLLTFSVGNWYHEQLQRAMEKIEDFEAEVQFDWRPQFDLYGRADGVIKDAAVEIKSSSSYGFDIAVGKKKSDDGPGPKIEHLLQVGFAALSPQINKENVLVVYANKDQQTTAEWFINVDEPLTHLPLKGDNGGVFMPTVRILVQREIERLMSVLEQIDKGTLPGRSIPGIAKFIEKPPASGTYGQPWNCRYCAFQPRCAGLAAGPIENFHVESQQEFFEEPF